MDSSRTERNLILARRQQCACLIQELGSRLQTTQVVINAGIYYMHHFYEVFSPETIKPILVAIASFYCACKTEDFSRKLAFLIKATYDILKRPVPDEGSDTFKRLIQNIHALEATLLMVIGFQTLEVKQPHVLLVNAIRANKFPKEISHTSYYICTNILHLTTLILRHSAEAIAAASLYIAAKWNGSDIQSSNGEWYHIFSPNLSFDEISKITDEFTLTFQSCDAKIREQLRLTLRSRKLQRESKNEVTALRSQDAGKRPMPEPPQSQKSDSWKSDRRLPNANSSGTQPSSHHQPSGHHSRPPHASNPQSAQNYSYHHRPNPPPHHHMHSSGGSSATGNQDHFNRRPPPGSLAEPDSKRPRFDRSYPHSGRHSPTSHYPSHRYDGSSHFNPPDPIYRHGGGGAGAPPGSSASRSHDFRSSSQPSGYGNIPSKPTNREQSRGPDRSMNSNRIPSKPGAHAQNLNRPMKHDFNDYF